MRQKLQRLRQLATGAALTAGVTLANAAATTPFDDVIADGTAAVTSYAGALVVLSGVAVIFMIGMKYVKKITRAA